jgi:hypothetical protein
VVQTRVPMWRTQPAQQNKQEPAPAAPAGDPQQPPASTGPQGDPDGLGEAGRRALQVERDARAAAEAKLRDLEAEKLNAQQRAELERDEAKSKLTTAEATVARLEAALNHGLSAQWAKRLVGSTAAELEADAKAVAADLAAKAGPNTPKPDPSQGRGNGGADKAVTGSVEQAKADYLASRVKK